MASKNLQQVFGSAREKFKSALKSKGKINDNKPSIDTLRKRHRFTTAEIKKNKGI